MTRIPDVMFVVDPRKEKIAIQERIFWEFPLLPLLTLTATPKRLIMLSPETTTLFVP